MNEHIEQAAAVIAAHYDDEPIKGGVGIAAALAAAGLLVTPEQRAVLDAADLWRKRNALSAGPALHAAVDALRAATPKDGE